MNNNTKSKERQEDISQFGNWHLREQEYIPRIVLPK